MDRDKLIQKWLLGELTPQESREFDSLKEAPFYKNIIQDASRFKASEFSAMEDFETFRSGYMHSKDKKVKKISWARPLLRIASVMVLLFGIYYIFLLDKPTEIQTLVAEHRTVELPDASQVVLNANSEIRYSDADWDESREIQLQGEAFFDVAKGARFEVITPQGTVTVLGTEFNVKQRGAYFEVACFEGKVRVVANEQTKELLAGENFRILDGKVTTGLHRSGKPEWTDNRSYFQRIPLQEVFAELQRQYDITVTHEGVDTSELFTGGFMHRNLDSALIAISEPLGLHFQIIKPGLVRFSMGEE